MQSLTREQRKDLFQGLPDRAVATLLYDWVGLWARDSQIMPPGEWRTWLFSAGRGAGKTRCAAEAVRYVVETGRAGRIALVASTSGDCRDTMVEGESGLLAVSPPWNRPRYEPSKRRLTWPNGARAHMYSSEEPDRLRGPQHDWAWCDELASWADPATWDMLLMGLRLGADPRAVVTTTPKPLPLFLRIMKDKHTVVTRGSTYDNAANLASGFLAQITALYRGTRLGRQELLAEVLEEIEGAFWSRATIETNRVGVAGKPDAPLPSQLQRIVVAIDPAPSHGVNSDETGIVVTGLGYDGHGYVLEDCSMRGSPDEWARKAVIAYHRWKADLIVGESNNGGDMVESTVHTVDENVPFKLVRATRGKSKRAEPVAALDEQGRVHHVGFFDRMEDQMAKFTGVNGRRDDRADARCWSLHELFIESTAFAFH